MDEKSVNLDTREFRRKLKSIALLSQSNSPGQVLHNPRRAATRPGFQPVSLEIRDGTRSRPAVSTGSQGKEKEKRCYEGSKEEAKTGVRSRSNSENRRRRQEKRIERARMARLFLIGRKGPNSFQVVAENPKLKFLVQIDEKPSCSCGRTGVSCLHVLFVLTRVLRVSADDSRLFSQTLSSFQVEELLSRYEHLVRKSVGRPANQSSKGLKEEPRIARCRSQLDLMGPALTERSSSRLHVKTVSDSTGCLVWNNTSGKEYGANLLLSRESSTLGGSVASEDSCRSAMSFESDSEMGGACCPICLLVMNEGDALSECQNGCRNKIHSSCLHIWEDACRDREKAFTCPLCRYAFTSKAHYRDNPSPSSLSDFLSPEEHDNQSLLEYLQPHEKVLGEDNIYGLVSNDLETVQLALDSITSLVVTSGVNLEAKTDVTADVIKCLVQKANEDITCLQPYLNNLQGLSQFIDIGSKPGSDVAQELFHLINDSSNQEAKHLFFATLLNKNDRLWVKFLSFQLKAVLSDVKHCDTDLQLKCLLTMLKMKSWKSVGDDLGLEVISLVVVPVVSLVVQADLLDHKETIKQILSHVCTQIAASSVLADELLGLMKKEIASRSAEKLCNYVEKRIGQEKLKIRLGGRGNLKRHSRECGKNSEPEQNQSVQKPNSKQQDTGLDLDGKEENSTGVDFGQFEEGSDWLKGNCVGTGGHSRCYVIKALESGQMLVVKQISLDSDALLEQQKQEFELLRSLSHPNIVRVFAFNTSKTHFNIYQEWIPGGTVSDHVKQFGPFGLPCVKTLLSQLCSAVQYLHFSSIVHRDLKGDNLLLDCSGLSLKLCDFGTAALLSKSGTGPNQFANELVGTVCFMAPEVIRGSPYGRSCDIWSFGCVIIQMCGGVLPWNASLHSNKASLMYQIGMSDVPPPELETIQMFTQSRAGSQLKDLASKCLQLEAKSRIVAKDIATHELFT